ncbi:hypothetical protein [Frankia sp. EI5c]|uniref:hypothetical protein n=1 Tax=Frankia sp. EI5c TaxID=683316 RepID=UPI0012FFA750|nr:hypothetical protein [Frankia sp. EI5c]
MRTAFLLLAVTESDDAAGALAVGDLGVGDVGVGDVAVRRRARDRPGGAGPGARDG